MSKNKKEILEKIEGLQILKARRMISKRTLTRIITVEEIELTVQTPDNKLMYQKPSERILDDEEINQVEFILHEMISPSRLKFVPMEIRGEWVIGVKVKKE